nr:13082_t:CDS:2 [Entrophospora candida]
MPRKERKQKKIILVVDKEEKDVFNSSLDHIIIGSWSAKAFEEAKRLYNNVNVVIDAKI